MMAVNQIQDWVWRGIARVVDHRERVYVLFDYAAAYLAAAEPMPVRYPLADACRLDARDCVLWQPCFADVPGMDSAWGRGVPTVNAAYLARLLAPEDAPWDISAVWRDDTGMSHAIRTRYQPDGSFSCAAYVDGQRERPPARPLVSRSEHDALQMLVDLRDAVRALALNSTGELVDDVALIDILDRCSSRRAS